MFASPPCLHSSPQGHRSCHSLGSPSSLPPLDARAVTSPLSLQHAVGEIVFNTKIDILEKSSIILAEYHAPHLSEGFLDTK